ncbi:hypothetical protein HY969_02470 [Candidatus Kaiserbacteria bacterium]|nr:hypothetical protein [Candidatus Kaiserbacteria bacterium]
MERTSIGLENLFEAVLRTDTLLPENLESKRLQVPVYDALHVKGRNDAKDFRHFSRKRDAQDEYEDFLGMSRPFLLQEVAAKDTEPVFLMDKLTPHSLYEVMIMSASVERKSSILDHDAATRRLIFNLMSKFPEYAHSRGLYPYLAFNYDPLTQDRESGQAEKRFHAHLIGRTSDELAEITEHQQPLGKISPMVRRRLVDETSILGSLIAFDYFKETPFRTIEIAPPLQQKNGPLLEFVLKKGWDDLSTREFEADFCQIHSGLEKLYELLVSGVAEGQSGEWKRPQLRLATDLPLEQSLREMKWLSPESRSAFLHFVKHLKSSILEKTHLFRNPKYRNITTHVYPLAGLCYSVGFCEDNSHVKMVIKPQIFSDFGGAGLEKLNGIITRIRRGVGTFDDKEMAERKKFQSGFVERIEQSMANK